MNSTEKAIIVGLAVVVAVALSAGAAYGYVGQTSAARQQGGGGMMSGESNYGGGGMMGGGMVGRGTGTATSTQTRSGGMMEWCSWEMGVQW
jgi:Spy/CpxP family protein refolding chaperone